MKPKHYYSILPLMLASPLALADGSVAESESKNETKIERISVWGSPVAANQDSVNQDTIKMLNKQNVAEALNIIPGVSLQKSGRRNEVQVKVRGFDSKQVPLFFDGIPIYIPYDGNLDLGRFLASDLASVEVSKGYASLLQGPNMMGGAINLTTRRPKKSFEAQLSASQGWARGEDNGYSLDASLAGSNDWGFIQLSGNKLDKDFVGLSHDNDNPIAGSDGKRANSAYSDSRGTAKFGLTPNETDEYIFTYIRQEGEKNSPPYAGTEADIRPTYWQWPQYDKQSFYYSGYTEFSPGVVLHSRLYRDEFENTLRIYKSLENLQQQKGPYSHYDDASNGAGLQLSIDMRKDDILSFAAHWKEDLHKEQGEPDGEFDKYKDRTLSAAVEYQWALRDNLDLVGGISYDSRKSLEGYKHEKDGSLTRYEDNSQHAFSWQVMVRYELANLDTLQLSLSQRSRFPTLKERYTTFRPAYGQTAIVNPHLEPERATNLELSYQATLATNWQLDSSVYYNRVSDAILTHNITPTLIQNRNSGRVDYSGLDLGIYGDLSDWASVGLSYSYIHADVEDEQLDVTGLPDHQLFAWVKLTPLEELDIILSQEARSDSLSNSNGNQVASGFGVTGIRFDYRIWQGLSVNASVNNLFDRNYAYSEGFPEEGRNYWLGVEYRFGH
ncbi:MULTISPECIES: TonB-dependent receptor plug domain-containing protein [Shewanella]|uniref:TonB-dependent receptor plug domain-containing protein n=1 Tax=Shewanella TaxID=22 RepID=UPI001C2CA1C3|nr:MULTISPECIES: TonB-dependent receptor [Shewanella]WKC42746.1 TonB-dependent receptor [Shewanella algae]